MAKTEIRINNIKGIVKYKGVDEMDADAFMYHEHIGEVLESVVDAEVQLWYGGIHIADHKHRNLEAGDSVRFKFTGLGS